MAILLWELAGADPARRFSPYCWRIRLALRHKGLEFQTRPWRFTDKALIAHSGGETVPVLEDGGRVVRDSWAIAEYLEATYPDRPSIFGGAAAKAVARFVTDWTESVVQAGMMPFVARDILDHVAEADRVYFRQSREARLRATLEAFCAGREDKLPAFHRTLTPLRLTLSRQPFLAGDAPAWPDFAVFGSFQWARCISPFGLIGTGPIHDWRERMLDAYDGEGRKAVGY